MNLKQIKQYIENTEIEAEREVTFANIREQTIEKISFNINGMIAQAEHHQVKVWDALDKDLAVLMDDRKGALEDVPERQTREQYSLSQEMETIGHIQKLVAMHRKEAGVDL